jgi:hypothetical protein
MEPPRRRRHVRYNHYEAQAGETARAQGVRQMGTDALGRREVGAIQRYFRLTLLAWRCLRRYRRFGIRRSVAVGDSP